MPFNGIVPAVQPEIASFGLLSVADVTDHSTSDGHWINGFDFETEACNFNASLMQICAPGEADLELFNNASDPRFYPYKPFAIKAQDECLTPGWKVADRKAALLRNLDLVTQKALEMELWGGAYTAVANADEGRWLASEAATNLLTSGAVSPGLGLALLEKALGDCGVGGKGIIHVPRDVATILDTHAAPDGKVLKTKNNENLVVSGVGYSGSAPGEEFRTDPLKPWIYATGPIVVHLGENELITPQLEDAINVRTNVINWVAVKPAAVYWDGCCHFGVQIDLELGGSAAGDAVFPTP